MGGDRAIPPTTGYPGEVRIIQNDGIARFAPLPAEGALHIAMERHRQTIVEGWTNDQDDTYTGHQLALAGAWYAMPAITRQSLLGLGIDGWPWPRNMFKPDDTDSIEGRIRELAKAGALIAAEIDRLQRSR